jgi:hypothetical protein
MLAQNSDAQTVVSHLGIQFYDAGLHPPFGQEEMPMILPHAASPVYSQIANLLGLLAYAQRHSHSAAWIPALLRILERKAVAHG